MDVGRTIALAILFGALVGWFLGFMFTAAWEDLFGSKSLFDFHYNNEHYDP